MMAARIEGFVKPGFEAVRDAFAANFERRNELGAACCVYYRGAPVVDLWGGVRNEATGEPWEEKTMALVFSTTKGISALTMAHAHSRGLFDYGERVAAYWPQFARHGKENITVRQLMEHQAGLYAFKELADKACLENRSRLAQVLADQTPAHPPGQTQYYHAISLGFYESELLSRVDGQGRSIGRYFKEEIADPLGLDFHIRLPEEIPNSRLAVLRRGRLGLADLRAIPLGFLMAAANPRSALRRSLEGSLSPLDPEKIYARNFEVPAGGGVGTARAIARLYGVFATGGKELGIKEETLRLLSAPPVPPARGFRDRGLKVDVRYTLGLIRPDPADPFGSPGSFGTPGFGGSFGFADPKAGIGYGYTLNGLGMRLIDPRDIALRKAMYDSIGGAPS